MSQDLKKKGAGNFDGNFFKDFYFSQGDYRQGTLAYSFLGLGLSRSPRLNLDRRKR